MSGLFPLDILIPEAPTPGVRNYLRGMWRRKTYRIANKNRTYDPAKYSFEPVKITPRREKDFTSEVWVRGRK